MENWVTSQNLLAFTGVILMVVAYVSFKLGGLVSEKAKDEPDKFLHLLWLGLRLVLLLLGLGGIALGGWFVWPVVSEFFIDLVNGVYL